MKRSACAVALMCASLTGLAQEPLKILAYPLDVLAVYDRDGNMLGEIHRDELPRPQVTVEQYIEQDFLVQIQHNGAPIYLDTMELTLNQGKEPVADCRVLKSTSVSPSSKATTVMGYAKACGE